MSTDITPATMIDLLSLMTVYDQRVVGPEDVKGWLMIADLESWTFAATRQVIIEHYRSDAGRGRITPAHVTDRIRAVRRAAAETYTLPDIPPVMAPGMTWPEYLRSRRQEHVDACLERWAATGEEPTHPRPELPRYRSMQELADAAPKEVRATMRDAARRIGRRP